MIASGVFAGAYELDWAYGRVDNDGVSLGDELDQVSSVLQNRSRSTLTSGFIAVILGLTVTYSRFPIGEVASPITASLTYNGGGLRQLKQAYQKHCSKTLM